MRRRNRTSKLLAVLAAGLLFLSLPMAAAASRVTDLIEERALAELGRVLPAHGRIDVRLAEGMVKEGEFIREFWIDENTGQFIANVVTGRGDTERVWGIAVMTVSVPVPTRRVLPDEIVSDADLTLIDLPMQRLGSFAVLDQADLVGQQVRRMLVPGRPVPRQSVIPPKIVLRGQKVKILLQHGGLQLTARGRAMDDAHLGQELRVVNLSSNKAISAIATARGVVEVDQ
jgi:flagella basal body P-ring formation protein FlgA